MNNVGGLVAGMMMMPVLMLCWATTRLQQEMFPVWSTSRQPVQRTITIQLKAEGWD